MTESSPIHVVMLSGAPGVGKTEVGRLLSRRCRVPAAFVDLDCLADVQPWKADEPLYQLMSTNLRVCLPGYREWGVRVLVVSGVLVPGRALDHFAELLAEHGLTCSVYGLSASRGELIARVHGDRKLQDADGRLAWAHINDEIALVPGIDIIDTEHLDLEQVVSTIAQREPDWFQYAAPEPSAPRSSPPELITVASGMVAEVVTRALANAGFAGDVLVDTVDELIAAEMVGTRSHGLLRVSEYVDAVRTGDLRPDAIPTRAATEGGVTITGMGAPSVVIRRVITEALVDEVDRRGFAVVGLREAAHLGRLRPLAEAVTDAGNIVLGFANLGGGGRKVGLAGGVAGAIATNPIVFGCPASPGRPVILDMSTSATSEGTIRSLLQRGLPVAPGLLSDSRGRPVLDPMWLYTDPPRAFLAPLGGIAEHKGFGLAVIAEIFAGVVAGGGFVGREPVLGSAGLFIAFPGTALGRDASDISADICAFEEYIAAIETRPGQPAPRVPGRGIPASDRGLAVELPHSLWRQLELLAAAAEPADQSSRRSGTR